MKRHHLHNINLENKTALCAVCGPTEIHIIYTRQKAIKKLVCHNKARETWLISKEKDRLLREERRSQPEWKPRHVLYELDKETLRATCAICGPTDVRKSRHGKYTSYGCATKMRAEAREYMRLRYRSRLTHPHALSEIDEEKKTAVCVTCGPVDIIIRIGKRKITRRCINVDSKESA